MTDNTNKAKTWTGPLAGVGTLAKTRTGLLWETKPKVYIPKPHMPIPEDIRDLVTILSYARPEGTWAQHEMIERFIEPTGATEDLYGNWYLDVGDSKACPVIWSSHTDTAHWEPRRQWLHLDLDGILTVHFGYQKLGCCLGADDGAGVWLILEMIRAGVPGRYIFHTGEEIGCEGSEAIARDGELIRGFKMAIALDRAGLSDVVTHQMGSRCCSEEFASQLARLLPGSYKTAHGVYTDTASYMRDIPECTNLSVGYYDQHGASESLDTIHIRRLRDSLCAITDDDIQGLPIVRDPSDYKRWEWGRSSGWAISSRDGWTTGARSVGVSREEPLGTAEDGYTMVLDAPDTPRGYVVLQRCESCDEWLPCTRRDGVSLNTVMLCCLCRENKACINCRRLDGKGSGNEGDRNDEETLQDVC